MWVIGKKFAAVQPSQIQDFLRWSKAESSLSTQKYIANQIYIFFCICKKVSVKQSVVINLLCHRSMWGFVTKACRLGHDDLSN